MSQISQTNQQRNIQNVTHSTSLRSNDWVLMNIHINHFESSNLRGLESWQPARDPEGTWVEAMEEWLVDLWKYRTLIGSICQSLYGRIYGRFYSIFYFWKGLAVTACCFFSAKTLLHIIDSHKLNVGTFVNYPECENRGIVMRRSAREMDSGAPTKNMFFFFLTG